MCRVDKHKPSQSPDWSPLFVVLEQPVRGTRHYRAVNRIWMLPEDIITLQQPKRQILYPNSVVEWLALLLRVWEVPD
jgi:hypothetical protein